jgi:hypothetical protein
VVAIVLELVAPPALIAWQRRVASRSIRPPLADTP